jgi:hypothetical protein
VGQFDGTILAQQRRKSAIHLQIVEFSSNFRMKNYVFTELAEYRCAAEYVYS